ncbi:MAG: hypothetical protein FWG64_04445 [Firmicutes bacterium]|nr:hypothetical protein [Bacillota bacterium]
MEVLLERAMQIWEERGFFEKRDEELTAQVTEKVTAQVTEEVTAQVTEEVTARVTEEVTAQVTLTNALNTAKKMLSFGIPIEQISVITNLPIETIKELQ